MKHPGLSWCTAGVLLAAFGGYAQQAPQGPLVSLNVQAMDGKGQPVTDLASGDFEVSDGGKVQPVAFFHAAPVTQPVRVVLGAHEYSNRADASAMHVTLVVFDMLNSAITEQGFVRNEVVRALQSRESSDYLYVYLLTREGKLSAVHGIPENPEEFKPAATPWTRQIKPLLDDGMKAVNRLRLGGIVEDNRVRMTYNALDLVVSSLEAMPGRKNLVWISRGIPITLRLEAGSDQIDYAPLLRKLSEHCERAKVTVYTVNQSSSATPSAGELTSVETMQQLANQTGGRLYPTNDTVGEAITQATGEWRQSYTIAYRPAADNWDGKQHKIRVTCTRRGVNLLFRQSYYADKPGPTDRMRAALQAAVSSPFDSPEMGLRVAVSAGTKPGTVHFQMRVDAPDVLVAEQGERSVAHLVATFVDFTAKGPAAVSQPAGLDVSMTREQREAAVKGGILVEQDRPVGQGIEKMRVIVYDPAVNLVGSLTVPVR